MKKTVYKFLVGAMIITNSFSVFGATHVYLNGNKLVLDKAPFVENNRTYLPLRAVSENLGASVAWENQTKTITISKNNQVIVLRIGSTVATVNNKAVTLDVAPKIKDNTTYVPVRFVADCLGVPLDYYAQSGIVSLITDTNNAAQIKQQVSQIKEVITAVEDLPSTPVSKFGNAFTGLGAKKLFGGYIDEVTIITKADLPIQVGDLTLYDIYFNADKTLSLKTKKPHNLSPKLRLSDSLGLVRYRDKDSSTTNTSGITTSIYTETSNTDWELDGMAYRKYTLDKVNYFVIKENDTLVAISRTEVQ